MSHELYRKLCNYLTMYVSKRSKLDLNWIKMERKCKNGQISTGSKMDQMESIFWKRLGTKFPWFIHHLWPRNVNLNTDGWNIRLETYYIRIRAVVSLTGIERWKVIKIQLLEVHKKWIALWSEVESMDPNWFWNGLKLDLKWVENYKK